MAVLRKLVIVSSAFLGLIVPGARPATAQASDSTSLFAVTFTTGPAWDPAKPAGEQRFISDHSANLFRLRDSGTIALGGRFGAYGLVVVRAISLESARQLFQSDLAVSNGVFDMQIEPWLTIFDGCVPGSRSNGERAGDVSASTDRRSS